MGSLDPLTQQSVPSPLDPLQGLLDAIPGGKILVELLSIVRNIEPFLTTALKDVEGAHPLAILEKTLPFLSNLQNTFNFGQSGLWTDFAKLTTGSIFKGMLNEGLGVDTTKFDADTDNSLTTVDTIMGFALVIQFISGALSGVGEGALASRWGKGIHEALSSIPEEMGLSWALGLVLDKAFEAAFGTALLEGIRKQKLADSPDWPVVRAMLRQHIIDAPTFDERLAAAGFSDYWKEKLHALADQFLPVGDLANMYQQDVMTEFEIWEYLHKLGFSEEDITRLLSLYVHKATTAAGAAYASVARALFDKYLITEEAYRAILDHVNFPKRQIEDDIAAITLEHAVGRQQTSAATIKSEYQHQVFGDEQAVKELVLSGYDAGHATELVNTWKLPPLVRQHGLSQAKILSYFISGLLDPEQARTQLLSTGLRPSDVDFLLAHPKATSGVRIHQLTPSLIQQAYIAGAIQQDQIEGLLAKANVPSEYISDYEQIILYRKSRTHGGSANSMPLNAADIRDAFKYGLMDMHTAINNLVQLGYSEDNALLLLEITNRGAFITPPAPLISSLAQAEEVLTALGFQIIAPPDPLIVAAEDVLAQHGYSWVAPTDIGTHVPG